MAVSEVSVAETPPGQQPGTGQGEGGAQPDSGARPQRPARAPRPPARPRAAVQAVGLTLMLAALLVLGFFVYLYGLSGVSEARSQTTLYRTLAGELSQAVAPVGPAGEGAPVAILDIPSIGISDLVVVEGTTSGDLTRGPGHVRTSVLPGEEGVSVLYGRRTTFGGPFAHLMRLNPGDTINVTTGLGVSTYTVASFGTAKSPAPDPTPNRLVLETADSSLFPGGAVMVTADLKSQAGPNPGGWPIVTPQEYYLAGDPSALIPLLLWSQALLLASAGTVYLAHRWSRWAAVLCAVPVIAALAWSVYENLAILLPNLY